jgi:hypothetical protein
LQTEFIPVVGNTHELQNGRSPAREWFMKMATSVNAKVLQGQTSQGFYVAAPDGTAYGFNNNRTVDRVSGFMDQSLKKWRENPGDRVLISEDDVNAPFSRKPDAGVTVVRVYSRIKPLPEGCHELNRGVGRDHLWIYPEEAKLIAETTERDLPLPRTLSMRLVRFHLVDNVRGEPDFWKPDEVKRAEFKLRRSNSGAYTLTGNYSMSTASGDRGLEGALEGQLRLSGGKIVSFKAFGKATAWGAGTYTPRPPEGKFPLLFAFQVTQDEASKVVPPQGNLWGNEYRSSGR